MTRSISRTINVPTCLVVIGFAVLSVRSQTTEDRGKQNAPAKTTTPSTRNGSPRPKPEDYALRPEDPTQMEIVVTAPKKSYRPLEPIELAIELHNRSQGDDVKVPMESSVYPAIPIDARDERGLAVEKTRFLKNHSMNHGNFYTILPRGSFRPKLLANLVNDMTDRGEYTIVAHAAFYSKANGGRRWASSKPIKVRVEGEPFGSDEEEEK